MQSKYTSLRAFEQCERETAIPSAGEPIGSGDADCFDCLYLRIALLHNNDIAKQPSEEAVSLLVVVLCRRQYLGRRSAGQFNIGQQMVVGKRRGRSSTRLR